MSSEHDLIRLAQEGDSDAFCALAEAYERRIYSLAFHYCRDHQDAEDLSQEVWLKAFAAVSSFRFESTFYTWLRKIAINCFLNYRRSKSANSLSHQQVDENDMAGNETAKLAGTSLNVWESTLHNHLAVGRVMQALSDVTPQQRLIFLLKHEEGLTYEEISKALGCSVGTVKKSVSRTIAKVREALGANEESEDYMSCAATGILS